jgi:fibro-slime domain-containing protein
MTSQHLANGLAFLGICAGFAVSGVATNAGDDDNLPATITLQGVARDFRRFDSQGGHPDFQQYNTGHVVGLVADRLDEHGKPVRSGSRGQSVRIQCRDADGNNINPAMFDASLGDTQPDLDNYDGRSITSDASFDQWYRDVPGVNLSMPVSITLERIGDTSTYFFHAHDDNNTEEREGFFPLDGALYNDMDRTYNHNFFFTFELDTEFVVEKNAGQVFTFFGDDDVWVYIDGRLVIDLGGVHGAVKQSIDIDRLDWLEDGERVDLRLFFAERHTTRSNFRVETNLRLNSVQELPVTALYD